jgi:hypothetical protein
MIPQDYAAWHHCITVACGIKLTTAFITARIQALEDKDDSSTQSFIQFYGGQHYQNVLNWFQQAKQTARI